MDVQSYRELVSGHRKGVSASLLRGMLRVAETPYALAVGWRNRRFDTGRTSVHKVEVPVISVGNVTTGGTGKTPLVCWLAQWFRRQGVRVSLISRGYKAQEGARNDEALELEERLPDVPHLQNPDRVHAARTAIEEFDCQLIVLDDAFQHRRIARDLDIVVIDAIEPFGHGHLLPRGLLREQLAGLSRADVFILSRADAVDDAQREAIRRRVRQFHGDAPWLEVAHQPVGLINAAGAREGLDHLAGKPVFAFCGIGNPQGFRHSLDSIGCRVCELLPFPDHHPYERSDIAQLESRLADSPAEVVLCTHKDLVKVRAEQIANKPLWALSVEMKFLDSAETLEQRLRLLLEENGLPAD